MNGIRVKILGDDGAAGITVADTELPPDEAFRLFARARAHRDLAGMTTVDGETTIVLHGLLDLPTGMRRLVQTTFGSYEYVFGFVRNPVADQPDFAVPGEMALKLVSGRMDEAEEYALAVKLAAAAQFRYGGGPGNVWSEELPGGMTLVVAVAFSPM